MTGVAYISGTGPTLLVLALAGDALLAGLPGFRHLFQAPTTILGQAVRWLDTRLNRPHRSAADRFIRGAIVVTVIVAGAVALGLYLGGIAEQHPHGWAIETVVVASLIAQRRTLDLALAVRGALRRGGVEAGRAALASEMVYDTSALDEHAVARGAIENCAVKFCDGLVAPCFWYLLLGLPALFAYRAVNATADHLRNMSPAHAAFGVPAAGLDRVANYIPAPLGGVILSLAAVFVPATQPVRGLRTMLVDARRRIQPSARWTESAIAGALGLALAGPRRYAGSVESGPWVGDGRARATARDVAKAAYLFAVASVIVFGVVVAIALAGAAA